MEAPKTACRNTELDLPAAPAVRAGIEAGAATPPPSGRVAIWGSYNYGNYGDDLMAVVFARFVKQLGLTPVVFGISLSQGSKYGFEVTSDVRELIRNASVCVVGGGAWLVAETPRASSAALKRQQEFLDFAAAVEDYSCPTCLISIGSDGPYAQNHELSAPRQRLLRSGLCRLATVRLPGDTTLLEEYRIPTQYFPDILLDADRLVSVSPASHDDAACRIGLNLSRQSRFAGIVASVLSRASRAVEICFLDTVSHSSSKGNHASDFKPPIWASSDLHVHSDPVDMLRFISGLDLVITHKLHLGVTALSLSVPYISLGGQGKCRAFLETIGSPDSYFAFPSGRRACFREMRQLLSRAGVQSARSKFDFTAIEAMKQQSRGHLKALRTALQDLHLLTSTPASESNS